MIDRPLTTSGLILASLILVSILILSYMLLNQTPAHEARPEVAPISDVVITYEPGEEPAR